MNPAVRMVLNALLFGLSFFAIAEAIEERIAHGEAEPLQVWLAIFGFFILLATIREMIDLVKDK